MNFPMSTAAAFADSDPITVGHDRRKQADRRKCVEQTLAEPKSARLIGSEK